MFFLKYSPKTIDDVDFQKDLAQSLKQLDLANHLCFHGPANSGKFTKCMLFLNHIFQTTISLQYESIDHDDMTFNILKNNHIIFCDMALSKDKNYIPFICEYFFSHTNIANTPSKNDNGDKSITDSKILDLTESSNSKNIAKSMGISYVFIIKNADQLSATMQKYLVSFMDSNIVKFIFLTKKRSKMIPKIISRSFCIRTRQPTIDEKNTFLKKVLQNESIKLDAVSNKTIVKTKNIQMILNQVFTYSLDPSLVKFLNAPKQYFDLIAPILFSENFIKEYSTVEKYIIDLCTFFNNEPENTFKFILESTLPLFQKNKFKQNDIFDLIHITAKHEHLYLNHSHPTSIIMSYLSEINHMILNHYSANPKS